LSSPWISAIRLRTLPLSASSILAGSAFAFQQGKGDPSILTLTLITAFLLQILSNLANDYGDFRQGTDDESRVGPERVMQSGRLEIRAMKTGIALTAFLAFVVGCILLYNAFFPDHISQLLIFLGLGILSIIGAYKYTVGKNPYGYRAFGDLAVFVFFGLIGVFGTYWLYSKEFQILVLLAAMGFGFLITSVLNLNNLRDLEADKGAGKRTLAVILGMGPAKNYQFLLFIGGVGLISYSYLNAFGQKLGLASIFIGLLFAPIMILIFKKDGKDLDPYLKWVALITLMLSILPWFGLVLN
jgi:1,4-dihydroxy-2-naphthoate polyprenyltransferase